MDRDHLRAALVARHHREAARVAGRLARAGAWDDTVAATLFVHGRPGSPERAEADAWLEVPLAAAAVEATENDEGAWTRLLEALVEAGRALEAVHGLALAADAGLVGLEPYLRLVTALVARGELAEAAHAVEEAVRRFPDDARAWSIAAFVRLENGAVDAAAHACATALVLAPQAPAALLTAALLVAGTDAAARYLRAAADAGVPAQIIAGYRRLIAEAAG